MVECSAHNGDGEGSIPSGPIQPTMISTINTTIIGSFFFDPVPHTGISPTSLSLSNYFHFWQPGQEAESGTTFFYKNALLSLLRIVFILIGVAYFTLAERKIMAAVQRRRGPNIVGLFGLLQPLADGLKLLCKEMVIPSKSNTIVFLIAPLAIIILSLVG
jgi:NADH dehydrogenase